MASQGQPQTSLHQYLVPADELKIAEYFFCVKGFNPLPKGTKRKDHRDKWFSAADKEALWVIINALANTCGGVIDIRTVSGHPVMDLDLDDLQLHLSGQHNYLYKSCLTVRNEDIGSLLIVRKSHVFITANSHLYTRGLAETTEVFSHNELSAIVNQQAGICSTKSCLSGQSLVYKGICSLTEVKELEFKHFNCTSVKILVERISHERCEKTLFALPNLPNGGNFIVGVDEDTRLKKYVFVGVELTEEDKEYILEKLSKFMQVGNDGVPRAWGNLFHTDIKEGIHWFCHFIPLVTPPHTCNVPACSTCPSKGERFLIQLYFPFCPGGVFLKKPQAYILDESGNIDEVELADWMKKHGTTLGGISTTSASPSKPSKSPANSSKPKHVSSTQTFAEPKPGKSSKICADNVTMNFREHSSHKGHLVYHHSKATEGKHPEKFDLFKMSDPINYTPPRNEIDSVLSEKSLLKEIDKILDRTEAFGVAADSLFSCIKHSVVTQRPPHHLMDVLVVNRLASIMLFVMCSTFGSQLDRKAQKAYAMTLGRILKMQITSTVGDVIVQCRLLSVDGSKITTKCPHEWFQSTCDIRKLCSSLATVLTNVKSHFADVLMRSCDLQLSEEQLQILASATKTRFNFIEGPPGSGKTLLAQSVCEEHGKNKCVYISKSKQLTNFVNHKGLVNAICASTEADLLTTILGLSQAVQHVVIDDAQNMSCDENTIKQIFDFCQENVKTLHVFQDSRYQNFQHKTNQTSFVKFYTKCRDDCIYDSEAIHNINVIRRNSSIVGSYITALISDITPTKPVQCESQVPGDDVIVKHIKDLRAEDNNGLVAHVKGIVSKQDMDPKNTHYKIQDVAVIIDHSEAAILEREVTFFRNIFQTTWPESHVQTAEQFPVHGVVIDTLDNFSGLEARVVIFVLLNTQYTQSTRSISNPKYRIAVATRGIDRVDFVQEANLAVDELGELKFDIISGNILKPALQISGSFTTDKWIRSLAVKPDTGHVVLCHGYTDDPLCSVSCLTPDGQHCAHGAVKPPTEWQPRNVALHPKTSELVVVCVDRHDYSQHLLASYSFSDRGFWHLDPKQMMISGEWRPYIDPQVVWGNDKEAIVGLQDKDEDWWLVILNVSAQKQIRQVRTVCDPIYDMSVDPEGGMLYVCDATQIHIYTLTGEFLQSINSFRPHSVCALHGGRILVCQQDRYGGVKTLSVSLLDCKGSHIRDLIKGMPWLKVFHRVRLCEARNEMYISDGNKTLWKYDVSGRL